MVPRNMDHGARCDGIVLVDRPGGSSWWIALVDRPGGSPWWIALVDRPGGIAPGGRVRGAAARVRGAGLEDAGPWCAVL